jgi:hypothetical protein
MAEKFSCRYLHCVIYAYMFKFHATTVEGKVALAYRPRRVAHVLESNVPPYNQCEILPDGTFAD